MSPDQCANAATELVADRLEVAMEAVAAEKVTRIQAIIAVPVQYVGKKVIRSKSGEPPRMEFKNLRKSFRHRVYRRGWAVIAEIGSIIMRSVWLEKGTSRIKPRPHFEVLHKEMRGSVGQEVQAKL